MKKGNRKCLRESVIGLLAMLILPLGFPGLFAVQAASAAPPKKPVAKSVSTPKSPTASDAGVAQAEEHLRQVTVGFANGANSGDDVSEAKIALADTRLRAALHRNDFTGLRQDLETIVAQRQSMLERVNVKREAGAASPDEVTTAEEALAEARVRLNLYSIVLSRQKRLSETSARQSAGISPAAETEKAAASLQKAQRQFVERQFGESGTYS